MLLLLACHPSEDTPPKTTPPPSFYADNGQLYDAEGRSLLLRGVNARIDGLFDVDLGEGRVPLETIPPFTGEDCRFLSEQLGMNVLRLPVSWSAIEPQKGSFSEEYLERVGALVDDCAAFGVFSLVDLHQDAYSKEIGEDGAPLWAIVPQPAELLEGPLDDLGERRVSAQVLAAFRSLYQNEEGLTDAYAEMASKLAEELQKHPGVVALELQNQPVPLGDTEALDAFHVAVANEVRKVAPDLVLAIEPDSLRNMTDAATVSPDFPVKNLIYAPHTYVDVFEASGPANADAIDASLDGVLSEADTLGATPWIGEWGADPVSGRQYIQDCLNAMDERRIGGAFWVYEEWGQGHWGLYESEGDARGALREDLTHLLARPFPIAVDGTLVDLSWDGIRLHFSLEGAGTSPHLVSAPALLWPSTPTVTCDGSEIPSTFSPGRLQFSCAGRNIEVF